MAQPELFGPRRGGHHGHGRRANLPVRLRHRPQPRPTPRRVPVGVASLVAPAVDLSILGLLLGTRHLALHDATTAQLRPARRLLIFASLATLALNVADPLTAGDVGKAAFDAVGSLVLIGWAEVGPGLLQAITALRHEPSEPTSRDARSGAADPAGLTTDIGLVTQPPHRDEPTSDDPDRSLPITAAGDLIERARQEDVRHWVAHQRPILAETLRKNLRIGAARSRMLVPIIRAERSASQDAPLTMVDQSEPG